MIDRALLPPTLPALPGYELVVRYVPSDARDHAGGDWYDAFMLPDGRVGIVIGDIGGRGMEAAATMGQIRNALRAYALKSEGPAAVLDDLHPLVAGSAGAITLEPEQTLWLFTDGLIESRRRTLDAGLAELAQAAGRATGGLDEIADRLVAELPAERDDDIALLGLRRR